MRRGFIILVFLAALIPVAAFSPMVDFLGGWLTPGHRSEGRLFQQTLNIVSDHFVGGVDIDTKELTGEAIDSLLRSLDENSEYLPQKEAVEFEIETEQRYGGIGVEVEWSDERVTIVSPFEGSPGELVGLLPGDQIVKVEGDFMEGKRYREVIDLLRGPAGSRVRFSVFRPSTQEILDKEVVRAVIKVDSVRGAQMMEPGIGYIRITQFGTQTFDEFDKALAELEDAGLEGLILDLRSNPGGVLSAAVSIAGEFFEKGETVVYTKGKDHAHDRQYRSDSSLRGGEYPIVVLVNNGSASASEIVAGALQDIGRAKLVGTKTFGKGSVQTIFQYQSGDAMRLTTAMFFTPGGRVIHKKGIEPNIVVPIEIEDHRKLMLQRRYLEGLGKETFVEKYRFDPIEDKQLEVALKVVRGQPLR